MEQWIGWIIEEEILDFHTINPIIRLSILQLFQFSPAGEGGVYFGCGGGSAFGNRFYFICWAAIKVGIIQPLLQFRQLGFELFDFFG